MVLNHFDPSDISPSLMIDREQEVARVQEKFESYFDAIEQHKLSVDAKRIVCVTGQKGIGKSILAAKVVQELRKKYSGSTLFVSVDCRSATGVRGLLARMASGLVEEIATFNPSSRRVGRPFPRGSRTSPASSPTSRTQTPRGARRSTSS